MGEALSAVRRGGARHLSSSFDSATVFSIARMECIAVCTVYVHRARIGAAGQLLIGARKLEFIPAQEVHGYG